MSRSAESHSTLPRRIVRAYRFFREHAGYTVGHAAENALALARAEEEADARGWQVTWEQDAQCFCHEDDVTCICEREDRCECEVALLWADPPLPENGIRYDRPDGLPLRPAQVLCGICYPSPEYRRVIAAELAAEQLAHEQTTG